MRHIAAVVGRQSGDSAILEYADRHGLAIVTKDSDFMHRVVDRGRPPKVIFVTIGNGPWHDVADLLVRRLEAVEAFAADPARLLMVLR